MLISSTIHNNRHGDSVLTSGVLTLMATISCCRDTNSSCSANLRIFRLKLVVYTTVTTHLDMFMIGLCCAKHLPLKSGLGKNAR
jgi:hypothetical protein